MDIIYKNDTLFVDMDRSINEEGVDDMKRKLFTIINSFEINNIVINSGGNYKSNKKEFNMFLEEYKENFNGDIVIK